MYLKLGYQEQDDLWIINLVRKTQRQLLQAEAFLCKHRVLLKVAVISIL